MVRHAGSPTTHSTRSGRTLPWAMCLVLLSSLITLILPTTAASAATLPAGFQETVIFSGLDQPTVVRFAPDGRVFIAEKRGVIKVFDNLTDTTPTVFADLNVNVYNFWDRGLLGLALAPTFPTDPSVYVLYTYDHELGSTAPAPRWGTAGVYSDPCPNPPGATGDGCVVSGRLSRLQAAGNVMTGPEQVLVENWCQQYPSHSVGSVEFGGDGALYASGGDGASFNFVDYGQDGNPLNPCGDPPAAVGGAMTPPTAQGGALRSQDLRTTADPTSLDGAVIRVDLRSSPIAPQIVAYGLRNPFRITERPQTNEIWLGDVGWNDWEEINRIVDVGAPVENFGWPCYEGPSRQPGYDAANLNICEGLYTQPGAVTPPYHAYHHNNRVVPNETCPTGSSSIAGLEFEFGAAETYGGAYSGALFFADYARDCIWAMKKGTDGHPAPGLIETFAAGAANPVNLETGPGGDLFYVDFDGGTIRRIQYTAANQPPTAVATATPTSGTAPLTVNFDGSGSTDPDPGDTLTYAWDLDGDGAFDDATASTASFTYTADGPYKAVLRVTDSRGAIDDSTPVTITVGNTPPTPVISAPIATTQWRANETLMFSGSASDQQEGTLPASALKWELILHHCPSTCHTHPLQTFLGVGAGSFIAPDHQYPSHLELRLTATDSGGLQATTSVRLDPRTVVLTFQTNPGGLKLVVNGVEGTTTFNRTVIMGSRNSISAPSPQTKDGRTYTFQSWSDRKAQTHDIVATAAATYTAKYRQ